MSSAPLSADSGPPEATILLVEEARVIALLIAVAARNAVEDLHVAGAFSDAQAPTLNRNIRNRLFEALVGYANHAGATDPNAVRARLLGQEDSSRDEYVLLVRRAINFAIEDFAQTEGITSRVTRALADAAETGAVTYSVQPLLDLSQPKNRAQLEYLARSVPGYWEPPRLSPAFIQDPRTTPPRVSS